MIWNALEDVALGDAILGADVLRDAVQVLMLSACRRNEIGKLDMG